MFRVVPWLMCVIHFNTEQTMTKAQLRQTFRTMEPNRAQEIREAYYKALKVCS